MASSYPSELDTDLELPRIDSNVSEIGGDAINALRDAILAVETAVGANPQGDMVSLAARINSVIDDNGNIRSGALSSRGLISLPITNSQIASSAGINESKLSLDYGTAALNARISSATTDIQSVRDSFLASVSSSAGHYSGLSNRHDGYDIDLNTPVRSSETLETALHLLDNALLAHEASTTAHSANNITVNNEFNNISASDVQAAVQELDNKLVTGSISDHQDVLHENGTSRNSGGEQNGQGNSKDTVLAATIYQTDITHATNIIQVMHPNAARVTSKNLDLRAIRSQYHLLKITAGGVDRDPLTINFASSIPISTLDDLVEEINSEAHSDVNHYPISAYNTGGKLTIAHNMPGEQYTITIHNDFSYSAADELGFGDIANTEISWSYDNHFGFVGGEKIRDFRSLVKSHYAHGSLSNIISLGLGNLSSLGFDITNSGRILCQINNHSSDSSYNGTYYITSFPSNSTFTLNNNIGAGTFDVEVFANSLNFIASTRGEIYDIFVEKYSDGYGEISAHNRATYGTISGVDIKTLSTGFPTGIIEYLTDTDRLQLIVGGERGETVEIPAGFSGSLEVFARDNINSAIFQVTGTPPPAKRTINVSDFNGGNSKFYVASVHYAGNYGIYTLKYVEDKRLLGCTMENKSENYLAPTLTQDLFSELRNNGVIKGLDIIEVTSNALTVRGGKALVNGRLLEVETQDVRVNSFNAANRFLLLDESGKFDIKSEYDGGYSFSEMTENDSYGDNRDVALIAEFFTNGAEIDGYSHDRRLMISNLDKRLLDKEDSLKNRISQLENAAGSTFWASVEADSGSGDGYLCSIEVNSNEGFVYSPSNAYWYDSDEYASYGFLGGRTMITTRTFEMTDNTVDVDTLFRSPGITHVNLCLDCIFSGLNGGPFGVSGTASIQLGFKATVGLDSATDTKSFATAKTITVGALPSNSVTERYIASIPLDALNVPVNSFYDLVPMVRVVGSNYIDGGTSDDVEPNIEFDHIRIVASSYSVAANINEENNSESGTVALIGDIL